MNVKAIENIQALKKQSESFSTFFDKHLETTKNSSCDKHGAGFNLDSRFRLFSISVSFDSWTGYYGSSSCSSPSFAYRKEDVDKVFIRYLNENKRQIFDYISSELEKEAAKLKSSAEAEIESLSKMVNEL